ncbi:MAG TPA: cyclic nucleotide-binding domain-containing protein [Chloroflexota bacterium]
MVEVREVDVEQSLRNVPLFAGFQPKQLKSLARWTTTRTFRPGQTIVQEGHTGLGLYIIQSGRVQISMHSAQGERDIRVMGPGESFGEIALLDDRPRSATATAIDATTVVLLDKSQFLAEMRTYPEMALAMLPVLVSWLREADMKLAEMS